MPFFYDFHIHSCLSPCADDDMEPGNVCAMAALKGLQAIAITDHNTARNLRDFSVAAQRQGLVLLPGMELCTREEVHLLAYFPHVDAAEAVGALCRPLLGDFKNRPDFYGHQRVVDADGQQLAEEDALLIGALDIDLNNLCDLVRAHGGVPVPAHIVRGNGLVTMLGFVPPDAGFRTLEAPLGAMDATGYRVLHSSDAHNLGDIAEPEHTLPCEMTVPDILAWMRGE